MVFQILLTGSRAINIFCFIIPYNEEIINETICVERRTQKKF